MNPLNPAPGRLFTQFFGPQKSGLGLPLRSFFSERSTDASAVSFQRRCKRIICLFAFFGGLFLLVPRSVAAQPLQERDGVAYRTLSVSEYRDKMKAGWIGQIAGVCWGAPTEFRWGDQIIPEANMPEWKPEMINDAFGQDDLYVEMTFLRSMEEYGLDVSIRQAGIDFANSEYPLWCANHAGRTNLRMGIAPPDSSHPQFSKCVHDIDYQIEADFSGLIAPGMPNVAIRLGEKFGRLMNYGDGMYAGQFMGALYAEAFFETDEVKLVETALKAIPQECQYAEMVRDLLQWSKDNPNDWQATWQLCQKKYREDPAYQKNSNGGIDVKINGAYVLMGLLYGKGDLDQTIIISTRCGQDSDCNPSSSAGVLFTTLGFSKLPAKFSEKLDETKIFHHTAYHFPALLDVCEKLARQALAQEGGFVEKDESGNDVFWIPVKTPEPSRLVFAWDPEPIANSLFTDEERAKLLHPEIPFNEAIAKRFSGFTLSQCGPDMNPRIINFYRSKPDVLLTHPLDRETPCLLTWKGKIDADHQKLYLEISHHTNNQDQWGDWNFVVKINGQLVQSEVIDEKAVDESGWAARTIDLSAYQGQEITIELLNEPNGWAWEAGYWAKIEFLP